MNIILWCEIIENLFYPFNGRELVLVLEYSLNGPWSYAERIVLRNNFLNNPATAM